MEKVEGSSEFIIQNLQSLNTETTEDLSDLCVKFFLVTEDTEAYQLEKKSSPADKKFGNSSTGGERKVAQTSAFDVCGLTGLIRHAAPAQVT